MSDPTALSPDEIEALIDSAAKRMKAAHTRRDRVEAWEDLAHWIGKRTPETVVKLEKKRGIHRSQQP